MDRGLDALSMISVLLGLENLEENRQQSTQQEQILQELNAKFDRLERLVKEMTTDGALPPRNDDCR